MQTALRMLVQQLRNSWFGPAQSSHLAHMVLLLALQAATMYSSSAHVAQVAHVRSVSVVQGAVS